MTVMSRQEALRRLGLTEPATHVAIERAFRRAIKHVHPDSVGGDGQQVDHLVEARDAALADSGSAALVPLSQVTELIARVNSDAALTRQREVHAERTVRQVVMHHVGHVGYRRRRRTAYAIVSGGMAAVIAILQATTKFGVTGVAGEEVFPAAVAGAAGGFALVAAMFGLLAWAAGSEEKMLQLEIEQAAETLADKTVFIETMEEIAAASDLDLNNGWTGQMLRDAVARWAGEPDYGRYRAAVGGAILLPIARAPEAVPLSATAAVIGAVDFARLLTAKGAEQGVVIETMLAIDGDERARHGYRLAE